MFSGVFMIAAYKASFRKYTLALCAMAAAGSIAWFCSGQLAENIFEQRLNNVHDDFSAAQDEPNTQIDKALEALGRFDRSSRECSSEQYSQIADTVKNFRFIYQAAVQLENGRICSSYGQKIISVSAGNESNRILVKGRTYEISSDQATSADTDFIIISQQSAYVWVNKEILLDNMNLPEEVQLDLRGPGGMASITSMNRQPLKLQEPFPLEELVTTTDKAYVASPNNRNELISVLSVALSDLTALRWKLFVVLAFMLEALVYIAWRIHSYYTSTVVQLRKATRANKLNVHYQPIVNLRTGHLVGAEALSRWSLKGAAIPEAVFIAAAEKSDLICELTRSVMRQVAEDYSTYFWACKDFYIAVNLSAQDILDQTFPDFVASIMATYNLPASAIVFEVTERALLDHESASIQLHRLRACGHRIAIDDFGTGYSSLSFIESVPVDMLKIDRSFITKDKIAAKDALWRHITHIAKALKLEVVAEGVETQQQLPHLASEGMLLAQGWLFSKELPAHALARRFFQCPASLNPQTD
jgi:sensor c-di-GMP phosphodiesterase-like protein